MKKIKYLNVFVVLVTLILLAGRPTTPTPDNTKDISTDEESETDESGIMSMCDLRDPF